MIFLRPELIVNKCAAEPRRTERRTDNNRRPDPQNRRAERSTRHATVNSPASETALVVYSPTASASARYGLVNRTSFQSSYTSPRIEIAITAKEINPDFYTNIGPHTKIRTVRGNNKF
jgi:hypothetical protein